MTVQPPPETSTAERVKQLGLGAGFDLVAITDASSLEVERARFLAWLAAGHQGEMAWLSPERAERASDPGRVLPGARSVVCLGLSYWQGARPPDGPTTGRIARYAWGADYHRVMEGQLRSLAATLAEEFGGNHRWYVDTGPLMEKALAVRAGLGWYAKNTNVLTERFGSFILLGEILTTLRLEPDRPLRRDCGTCQLCQTACPTGALDHAYTIDSRKCISYLTIEHRGPIPLELRRALGNWVFGCDICQDVCPPAVAPYLRSPAARRAWISETRRYTSRREQPPAAPADLDQERSLPPPAPSPLFPDGLRPAVDLVWLLALSDEEYATAFRGTAIKRAKAWMLRRNAALALGNVGGHDAVLPLSTALTADPVAIVRGHAAWALVEVALRHKLPDVRVTLIRARNAEADESVLAEIDRGLHALHERFSGCRRQ